MKDGLVWRRARLCGNRHARPNVPAPPAIPGMDLAGNARETATLLPGADIEEGALRR